MPQKRSVYLEAILLLAILAVAAWLRAYNLDGSSLWSDEGNTWALLSRSFGQIARDAAADIHPPGYYWLLKVWTSIFGASVNGMRSFSVLAGVLLVFVVYRIGKQLDVRNPYPISAITGAPRHSPRLKYDLLSQIFTKIRFGCSRGAGIAVQFLAELPKPKAWWM